jgi:hypothetical protein
LDLDRFGRDEHSGGVRVWGAVPVCMGPTSFLQVDRVLIGNKIDMDEKRVRAQLERGTEKSLGPFACNFCVAVQEVPTKRGEELAKQLGIDFFETSAKADTDVDKAPLVACTHYLSRTRYSTHIHIRSCVRIRLHR